MAPAEQPASAWAPLPPGAAPRGPAGRRHALGRPRPRRHPHRARRDDAPGAHPARRLLPRHARVRRHRRTAALRGDRRLARAGGRQPVPGDLPLDRRALRWPRSATGRSSPPWSAGRRAGRASWLSSCSAASSSRSASSSAAGIVHLMLMLLGGARRRLRGDVPRRLLLAGDERPARRPVLRPADRAVLDARAGRDRPRRGAPDRPRQGGRGRAAADRAAVLLLRGRSACCSRARSPAWSATRSERGGVERRAARAAPPGGRRAAARRRLRRRSASSAALAVALLHLDRLPFALCVFRGLTGLPCPTCGSTRAVGRLAALDLAGALAMNPLTTLAAAGVVGWAVADLVAAAERPGARRRGRAAPRRRGCASRRLVALPAELGVPPGLPALTPSR